MTTAQESPNGHCVLPPPCSVQDPAELSRADLPTNKANNIPYPSYSSSIDTNELPGRCQFFFSDGRQCTMARSDIHPSLCRYHSEREDQLFGEPGSRTVAASLDLPELYSACQDLSTVAGVTRALGHVFRLLAQRRISRQEAATFCHLGQLLLRSISAMRVECVAADPASPRMRETSAAPIPHAKTADANGVFVQHFDQADYGRRGVILSGSESADVRGSDRDSRAFLRDISPDSSPQNKNGAASGKQTPSTVRPLSSLPSPAARALDSQLAQNQQLHKLRPQLSPNQHLRNLET